MTNKAYTRILNENQKKVLPRLSFLTKEGFYLAGGTALALQLGHRTSLDFDFYTLNHFNQDSLYQKIHEGFGDTVSKTSQAEDTLFCTIGTVDCSFFTYSYKLLKRTTLLMGVAIASLKDIAAMKLVAISRRPAKRDYIDIYYLLNTFSLQELFEFSAKKYPNFNSYYSLKALTYFEDIKDDERRQIPMSDKNFSWEKAKEKIFQEVKKYQLSMFKK